MQNSDIGVRTTSTVMPIAFSMQRRIQFAETDLAGVLHFSNYFRLMEEVEHAFWRSLGVSVITKGQSEDISWPRVSVTCDYADPLRFEDVVDLKFAVVKVGTMSVSYEIGFWKGAHRAALGRVTAVCCTWGSGEFGAVPIPEHLRALLRSSGDASS